MIRPEECEQAIRRGIDFLRQNQLPSGEFPTYVAKDENLQIDRHPDSSVFATAHIISCLTAAGMPESRPLVAKAADFLVEQRLPGGVWKFWTRSHPGFALIPPDVDDSSVVGIALRDAGRSANQNSALISANRDQRGRFLTWLSLRPYELLSPKAWRSPLLWFSPNRGQKTFFASGQARRDDVDAVVNANAVNWLADVSDAPKASIDWVTQVIMEGKEEKCDRFYQSRLALFHAVARCISRGVAEFGRVRDLMVERLHEAGDSGGAVGKGPHETALAVIVLNLIGERGGVCDGAVEFLVRSQRGDGSWPALAFYCGGFNRVRQWGSPELTTAFCVEALGRYLRSAK